MEVRLIEFSREATAVIDGEFYAAFQWNSYIARVTFADDVTVIVALPRNARWKANEDAWKEPTRIRALQLREAGKSAGVLKGVA